MVLFDGCLDVANLLIGVCNTTPKINGFVNKMFKMADKYLVEHNKMPGNTEQITRSRINSTFEAFRKKKEQMKKTENAPPEGQ